MKSSLLFLFLFLFLIVSVSAAPSFTFKKDSPVDLKVSCFDINNSLCSSATTCQLTVHYPNLTDLVKNQSMTYNDNYFNYSLNADQTANSGVYSVITTCQGTTDAFSTFTYEVTPTGKPDTNILENPILLIFGGLSFILLILGIYTQNPYLGFISGMLFLVLGVYTMIFGFNDVTNLYTRGIASTFLGLGLFFTVISAYEWTFKS